MFDCRCQWGWLQPVRFDLVRTFLQRHNGTVLGCQSAAIMQVRLQLAMLYPKNNQLAALIGRLMQCGVGNGIYWGKP